MNGSDRLGSLTAVDGSVWSEVQVGEWEGHIYSAFTDGPPRRRETVQILSRLLSIVSVTHLCRLKSHA